MVSKRPAYISFGLVVSDLAIFHDKAFHFNSFASAGSPGVNMRASGTNRMILRGDREFQRSIDNESYNF